MLERAWRHRNQATCDVASARANKLTWIRSDRLESTTKEYESETHSISTKSVRQILWRNTPDKPQIAANIQRNLRAISSVTTVTRVQSNCRNEAPNVRIIVTSPAEIERRDVIGEHLYTFTKRTNKLTSTQFSSNRRKFTTKDYKSNTHSVSMKFVRQISSCEETSLSPTLCTSIRNVESKRGSRTADHSDFGSVPLHIQSAEAEEDGEWRARR